MYLILKHYPHQSVYLIYIDETEFSVNFVKPHGKHFFDSANFRAQILSLL
uniref:Uncharacterized protein n=1 Tax=Lepeophtheirus salmonis TaxID=72036 RepID=A0A0K2V6M2_LEPSM